VRSAVFWLKLFSFLITWSRPPPPLHVDWVSSILKFLPPFAISAQLPQGPEVSRRSLKLSDPRARPSLIDTDAGLDSSHVDDARIFFVTPMCFSRLYFRSMLVTPSVGVPGPFRRLPLPPSLREVLPLRAVLLMGSSFPPTNWNLTPGLRLVSASLYTLSPLFLWLEGDCEATAICSSGRVFPLLISAPLSPKCPSLRFSDLPLISACFVAFLIDLTACFFLRRTTLPLSPERGFVIKSFGGFHRSPNISLPKPGTRLFTHAKPRSGHRTSRSLPSGVGTSLFSAYTALSGERRILPAQALPPPSSPTAIQDASTHFHSRPSSPFHDHWAPEINQRTVNTSATPPLFWPSDLVSLTVGFFFRP